MLITPDLSLGKPAASWDEVISRYTSYLQVRTWRGRTHRSDGTEIQDCIGPEAAARLRDKLLAKVESIAIRGTLPYPVLQPMIDALLKTASQTSRRLDECPKWLWHLWRAVILNRDGYRCHYCERSAWETYAELGRTLRFELDHRTAKARLVQRNDFDLNNIVAACRSCNVIKGQMEEKAFLLELKSLAKAVIERQSTV
jgi:5-methylcytosine-specific restriction endonuclease McrA